MWQVSSGCNSHSSWGTFWTCIRLSSRHTSSPGAIAQLLGTQTSRGIFLQAVSGWTFFTFFFSNLHVCTGHSSHFWSTCIVRKKVTINKKINLKKTEQPLLLNAKNNNIAQKMSLIFFVPESQHLILRKLKRSLIN